MAIDDDIESYLDPVPLNRVVRGGDKLQGVQPELLSHWNNLQGEFTKAGLTPEIKSGFRTAAQQNALFRNPATSARTKGNDGYVNISPHQRGDALDISFPAPQRAKGRQIIANYAQQNSLHVPSDEPWHIAIPRQGKAGVEAYLDPQQPTQSTQPAKPAAGIESYLDPQKPTIGTGRGAAMARAQRTAYPMRRRAQPQQPDSLGFTAGVGGARAKVEPATSVLPRLGQVPANTQSFLRQEGQQPMAQDLRSQVARQVESEYGSLAGNIQVPLTDPIGAITKSREQMFNEEVDRRLAAQQRANTPEMIAARKELGATPAVVRGPVAAANKFGGSALRSLSGVTSLLGIAPNQLSNFLEHRAQVAIEGSDAPLNEQGELIKRSLPEKASEAVTSLGLTIAQLVLLKKATGLGLGNIMAAETALQTSKLPLKERAVEIAKSKGMGEILEQHLSRPVSAALFGGPTAVQSGLSYAQGNMSLEDALLQTGVQAGAGAIMGGKPKGELPLQRGENAQIETQPNITAQPESAIREENGKFLVTQPHETGDLTYGFDNRAEAESARNSWLAPNERFKATSGAANESPEQTASRKEYYLDTLRDPTTPKESRQTFIDLAEEAGATPSEISGAQPVRHVDLQARYKIGDRAGDFKKETKAEAEARRAQVSQSVTPELQTEPRTPIESATSTTEQPPMAEAAPVATSTPEVSVPEGKLASQPAPSQPDVSRETTGIARRVEESRRGKEIPSSGEGVSAPESVERGRRLLKEGGDPQEAIDRFKKDGAVSADAMALVRARHEELTRAANKVFDDHGINSPQFKAAERARQDFWEQSVRPMQTAWSNTGRAQQGETDIDTGTFYGLYRAFKDSRSREPSSQEQAVINNLSVKSAKAESDVKDLSGRLAAELDKAAGVQDLPPGIRQAVKRFIDQSARETRRAGRQQTRKTLDEEAATIKTNLASAFQKVKSQTGVQPSGLARLDPEGEITKQLIAYAKNRVKAGITDAAQLVDDVHSAVKDFADVSKREVAEAILGTGLPKKERAQSEWAKVKTGIRQEVKDYTTRQAREDLGTRLQNGEKASPQDAAEVWKYARENYIDKGNSDFADVTQKVASDLGITPDQVRRSLASTATTKRLSGEMWKKMADRRQAKQNAESWIRQADTNPVFKAFENLRRLFFLKATAGHGLVAPFTHAPANMFIPSRWAQFWPNFGRTYQFLFSKGAHEQAMVDLERSSNYITAKRAGLANDPRRGYDEYQSPWMAKTLGKLGISGNRAFDSLKTMRQDMFDAAWGRMPKADRTPEMAKIITEEINSSTGASKALSGQDWPSRFASKALFAAPLEASRWEFLVRDNARALEAFTNWKKASPESRYMAKRVAARNAQLVATYASLLAMNQGLLSATGSKDKVNFTDPAKADFLAFKLAGHTISPASGMLTALRFVGTLASQAKNADLKKPAQAVEDIAKTTFKYGRSKLSPLFSTATDVALRSDYGGRPLPFSQQEGTEQRRRYTWPEYALSQQTPIPIGEAARDVYSTMREQGMADGQTKSLLKALAKSIPVGAVAMTGIRVGRSYQPSPEQEQRAARQVTKQSFVDRLRAGQDIDLDSAVDEGKITKADRRVIEKQGTMTPFQSAFNSAHPDKALDRYERMSATQRASVDDLMSAKAYSLLHSDALTDAQKEKFQQRIDKLGIEPRNPQRRQSLSPFTKRLMMGAHP